MDGTRLRLRRTKIVATVGPASDAPSILERLIQAGVDVFRLNLAHGEPDWHREVFARIHAVAERLGVEVGVLADLAGPKIRAGRFEGGSIKLTTGEKVTVTTRVVMGGPGLIPSDYEHLHQDVHAGDRILLDDGRIALKVEGIDGTEIAALVIEGGELHDRKGMNLPGISLTVPSLTAKDRSDARLAMELGVDFLGMSFVRSASDLEELKAHLGADCAKVAVMAKIEKPEALAEIDAVLAACDVVMVARGDLGVELPPERVPVIQDELIQKSIAAARPVIVATQMLESMIESRRPNRAEVSDIAHAVRSGADALMLAGETARGRHPVEAVEMMDRVIRETENAMWRSGRFGSITRDDPERLAENAPRDRFTVLADAVAMSAAQLSRVIGARALVVFSRTGATARLVCAARPAAPVIAASTEVMGLRRMRLLWGAVPVPIAHDEEFDVPSLVRRLVSFVEVGEPGQTVLVVRGFKSDPEENAPTLTMLTL